MQNDGMYAAAVRLFTRSFDNLLSILGTTAVSVFVFGIGIPVLIAAASVGSAVARRGWASAKAELLGHFTMTGVLTVIAWSVLFAISIVRTIYLEHDALATSNRALTEKLAAAERDTSSRITALQGQLDSTSHTLGNSLSIAEAFAVYRSSIGRDSACEIRISAPKESAELAIRIAQLVTFATQCKPTSIIESENDPSTGEEAKRGMVANRVVFHARKDSKGTVGLYSTVGNYLPVERSYDVPPDAPDHFIWLQFGSDIRWNSESR